jgi:hypothetical protein
VEENPDEVVAAVDDKTEAVTNAEMSAPSRDEQESTFSSTTHHAPPTRGLAPTQIII